MYKPELVAMLRKAFLRQIEDRLDLLRQREELRETGADGLTIEYMLRRLARLAGARREVHRNIATWVDHTFPPELKQHLFTLLLDIEDAIPWSGLSYSRAYRDHGRELDPNYQRRGK